MIKAVFVEREAKPKGLLKFRRVFKNGSLGFPRWGRYICQGVESDCDLVMGNEYMVECWPAPSRKYAIKGAQ